MATKTDKKQTEDQPIKKLFGPCLSVVLASLGISIVAVTLPELSQKFSETNPDVTLIVTIYILATTALIVPVGRAGDIFGKRNVLMFGLILYILGAVMSILAELFPFLIIGRLVQGIGAAAMLAMPMAQVRDIVPEGHVGRWMGVMGVMSAIGTASGPSLGGIVTAIFDWRAVYVLQIPLASFALLFCFTLPRERSNSNLSRNLDLAGASTLAVFLAALTFAISNISDGFNTNVAILFTISIVACILFLVIETHVKSPILPLALLQSKGLRVSLLMNVLISLVMMGILVVGPFFLTQGLGLTTAQMGLAMSIGPISSALCGIPAGRLTEKIGPSRAVILGAMSVTVGAAAMAGLPYLWGIIGFALAFILLAPGYQLFLAALNTSVMESATHENRGLISGLLNLSRNFGFIIGVTAMSLLFWSLANWRMESLKETLAIRQAMAGTFLVSCLLAFTVAVLAVGLAARQHPTNTVQEAN